jgi:hypothetical protein
MNVGKIESGIGTDDLEVDAGSESDEGTACPEAWMLAANRGSHAGEFLDGANPEIQIRRRVHEMIDLGNYPLSALLDLGEHRRHRNRYGGQCKPDRGGEPWAARLQSADDDPFDLHVGSANGGGPESARSHLRGAGAWAPLRTARCSPASPRTKR